VSTEYLGSLSTAQLAPGIGIPLATLIGELQAQVAALAEASLSIDLGSLSFAAQIEALLDLVAKLQASLALGLEPPSVSFSAQIQLDLQAKLALLLELQSALGAAGIHAIRYAGRADDMGSEVSDAVSGLPGVQASDACAGLVLLATAPAAIEALRKVFSA
jgi:hypothetical protein